MMLVSQVAGRYPAAINPARLSRHGLGDAADGIPLTERAQLT